MRPNETLEQKSKYCRYELFKFKTSSGSGHLVSSLSCVDILVSLYYDPLINFDKNNDIIIFGKAHGSPAVYPILADLGFFDKSELDKYCQPGGILKLHADKSIPGCHFVGGSLGNGLGHAAGIAMVNKNINVYCLLGDAELYEGSIWESLLFIAHHKINNLTIVIDRNKYAILGPTESLLKLEPLDKKFEAFNFDVLTIDGHNFDELRNAFVDVTNSPKIIIAKTIKGKGVSFLENKFEYHTIIPKNPDEIKLGLEELK